MKLKVIGSNCQNYPYISVTVINKITINVIRENVELQLHSVTLDGVIKMQLITITF